MSAALKVVRAGLFDTLQDLGRIGFMALGMPTAGAMDRIALSLANALCGNPAGSAGLEIGVMGPDLLVEADSVRVALVGALAPALIEGPDGAAKPIDSNRTHLLKRGQVLRLGMVEGASTACLAVAGGFALPSFMGSLSTYARAGVGGFRGRRPYSVPFSTRKESRNRFPSGLSGGPRAARDAKAISVKSTLPSR